MVYTPTLFHEGAQSMHEKPNSTTFTLLRILACGLVLGAATSCGPEDQAQEQESWATQSQAVESLGGPVILGGDDLTEHGGLNAQGKPADGWLYIQKALENIKARVSRTNDGTVAVLG